MNKKAYALMGFFAACIFWVASSAQRPSAAAASISGQLKEPHGGPLSGVIVRLTNTERGISITITGNTGKYRANHLLSGTYDIVAHREGYDPAVQLGIKLRSGQQEVVDFSLKPGYDSEMQPTTSDWITLLPPGEGKNLVQRACSSCHGLQEVLKARKSKDGWVQTVLDMQARRAQNIQDQDVQPIADYLATHFGPATPLFDLRKIKLAGLNPEARVIFTEYHIPHLDREVHPHDPAVDSMGNVWFTGQYDNSIGKFDLRTGVFTRYPSPTPGSQPHGITVDKQDNIWVTEIQGNKIAKLDPKSGVITEYNVPTPESVPHTPIFDSKGILWISQMGNIGRFDPRTAEYKEYPVPWNPARPYGIVLDSKDTVWFSDFRAHKIGRLDPQSGTITGYDPPTKSSGTRRIAVDSKDNVWFTQFAAHKIGKLDPRTKTITEYEPPTADSAPYEIHVDRNDVVWFSEANGNRITKFDLRTSTFTEYLLPSPDAQVRKVSWDSRGGLWMAESGADKICTLEEY